MPLTISNEVNELLYREDVIVREEMLNSNTIVEERQEFSYEFGTATFDELYFEGIQIVRGAATVKENLHIVASETPSLVTLQFVIKGEFTTDMFGIRKKVPFGSLEHNLAYAPVETGYVDVNKQDRVELIGLHFTRDRFVQLAENNGPILERLASAIAVDKRICLNEKGNQPITTRMLMVLEEIRTCQFTGGLKKLYLQSKVLEMLALQCQQHENAFGATKQLLNISAADRERLYYARDILIRHAREPLSLSALARQVGLNEFKLKTGFKQLFGNTVFGYLSDHRLNNARTLLLEGAKTVTEIADELGYASLQHFSNAFRKKFGCSPSKLN
ncbi:AraC family transcriptional regulator [Chitinophaga pendula]|uniref:helix-turn-helix transcriptional regulator n=1 Tax=Chitinophaga TaxID=79328 RepID=UPI000BAEB7B7|nr:MULTISPECIES: AraC family transcriptional regulator [Chitinophaga]ASZ13951.1 hypothetical protein CK934_24850 [Chitinophaga sp. MD30]UCJ08429.1 AraC family transcriptional regulator [Chitinophaga pendula]